MFYSSCFLGLIKADLTDLSLLDGFPYPGDLSTLVPPTDWTADQRRLAEFFNFAYPTVGSSFAFLSKGQLGDVYPWDLQDWKATDPAYDGLTSAYKARYEITGDYPPVANTYVGRPIPRPLYYTYATQQAMLYDAAAKVLRLDEIAPIELELTLREDQGASFPDYDTSGMTHEQVVSAIASQTEFMMLPYMLESACNRKALAEGYDRAVANFEVRDALRRTAWYSDKYIVPSAPFWHWGPLPRTSTYVDSFENIGSVAKSFVPPCDDCPPSFPSLLMHAHEYQLAVEVLASEKIVDTIVTEHTVTMPPTAGGSFSLGSGAYEGAFVGTRPPPIGADSAPTDEVLTTNGDTSETVGGTTTTVSPAKYAVFKVYAYLFGPHLIAPGVVGGFLDRPMLYLQDENGNSVVHFTNAAEDRRRLIAKAETMAKDKLIEYWGFLPPFAKYYGGTAQSYVQTWKGGSHRDLPSWDYFYRNASLSEKMRMGDFDFLWRYMFDIVVAIDPATTTTTTTGGSTSTSTTTIDTLEERDPITYTFTTTETKTVYKTRVRLRWLKTEANYYTVLARNVKRPYNLPGGVGGPFGSGPVAWEGLQMAAFSKGQAFDYHVLDTHKTVDLTESPYGAVLDPAALEIPSLTFAQSYALTKDLFRPEHNIMHYLQFGTEAATKANGILGQTLGIIEGGVYLSQQGSAAPVFPEFHESLVLDTHLTKWGKFSSPHKLLVDLSPINSHAQNRIDSSTFSIQAAMLGIDGIMSLFNEKPNESELRFGKLGYHRLGFTDLEELRVWHSKTSAGTIQIEPSVSGDAPEASLVQEIPFAGVTHTYTNHNLSARWYNVTMKGQYDLKSIEFIGRKAARR